MDNRRILSVAETFEGKTVLLTGATGFLGKLTLEKLLRVCPKIEKIYIVVRIKKGKDQNQRISELLESDIFGLLKRKTSEKFAEKIEVIPGDLALPNLGISQDDQKKLVEKTNFVIHLAATVRFDEKIRTAVAINIKGTRNILKMSKQMKLLEGFVYVSTAYSFCPRKEIEEKFYDPPYDVDKIINITDSLDDDDLLDYLTPKLLKDWPNTYALTKAIAEQVVKTESDGLPVTIVRPSIVMSAYQDPLPGWVDNLYGPTGAIVGVGSGLVRTMFLIGHKRTDVVPADYVVNCIIAAAWDVSNNKENYTTETRTDLTDKDQKITIYNYVSGPENPLTWEELYLYAEKIGGTIPSKMCLWYNIFLPAQSLLALKVKFFFLHLIPAYILDFIAKQIGRKPQLVKGYKKIHKFINILSYFTINQWKFENENTKRLWKKLTLEDRTVFPFSLDKEVFNWDDYFQTCIRGIRVYIFKDPMDTVPEGIIRYRKLKIYHYCLVSFLCLFVVGLLGIFLKVLNTLVW